MQFLPYFLLNVKKHDKIHIYCFERRLTCVSNWFEIVIVIRVVDAKILAFILVQGNLSQMIITA